MLRFFLTLSVFGFLGFENSFFENPSSKITMCVSQESNANFIKKKIIGTEVESSEVPFETDPTLSYSMPLFSKTASGDIILSWTEKDDKGLISLCVAFSKNQGKFFMPKKIVFSGYGIGNSRMSRAKILSKKDGSLVALFSNRKDATPGSSPRGGKNSALVFCESKDGGNTWSAPANVDSDPTTNLLRGFFDAVVMSNDEIAVSYLKDVKNSTKHEERDLRLVISKNGVFQPEKLIDPVVCDCCPINLLVDSDGTLHVFYRDNNDNIRDIARLSSKDNGQTFGKSEIVFNDKWEINGCPHSGAVSVSQGNSNLVSWFSGKDNEMGIRLTNIEGKKLLLIDEPSAKNQILLENSQSSILFWEQNKDDENLSNIAYRIVENGTVSGLKWVSNSKNSTNVTGLSLGNSVLIANETIQSNKKNRIKISLVNI